MATSPLWKFKGAGSFDRWTLGQNFLNLRYFFFVTMLDKEHFVRCLSGQCPQGNAYLVCFIMYIYNAHGRSCKGFVVRFIELKTIMLFSKLYELIIDILIRFTN